MDEFKQVATSFQPPKTSLSESKPLESVPMTAEHLQFAAKRARLLFGCYRKGDANDPETYTAAITAILADYDDEVIVHVTDPRTGIARTNKFMPNPAEVAEACDAAKEYFYWCAKAAALGWRWDGSKWTKE